MKKLVSILLFFVFMFSASYSYALPIEGKGNVSNEVISYAAINKELLIMENNISSKNIKIGDTINHVKELSKKQSHVVEAKELDEQELSFVQKRIEALGAVPENGEKEPRELADKRKEFNAEASSLKSKIAEADLIIAKIDELENAILTLRNKELLGNILLKQEYLVDFKTYILSAGHFMEFCYDIIKSPISWYKDLNEKDKEDVRGNVLYVLLTVLVSVITAVYLSSFIKRRLGYRRSIESPDYSQKVSAAIWVSIAYGALPSAIIGAFIFWFKNTPVINSGFFGMVLNDGAWYILSIFLSQAVVRVIFVPNKEKWRLIEVDNDKANSLSHALLFSIILISSFGFLQHMAIVANYPHDVIYFIKILSSGAKAFSLILVARRFLYNAKALTDEEMSTDEDIEELSLSSKISLLVSVVAFGVLGISFFGYVNLSEFIFDRFILSVLVVGAFYIFDRVFKVIVPRVLSLKFWTRSLRMRRKSLVNLNFWINFAVNPVVFFIASLAILALWGVSIDILLQNIRRFLTAFYIGGIKVSIISILFGIFVFFASWTIFKILKRSLLVGVLTKVEMDEGVRSSLASGFGFIGFIASALFAISVMGGNLGNVALVAGALSFGIGLGLQNIVNNFVSGIIILFERPIKIGDWVIINGEEGIVKQINIRATELETFTKSHVIIPNATILSNSLTNMTHSNKLGRVDVAVGVGYDSDIKLVKEILFDIASSNKLVMSNPAPFVTFKNLGESSLDFEVRCYVSNIMNRSVVANEIREEIINRFRVENIDIPFPQRVIHTTS